jgi:hypothetical protein
VGRLPCRDRGPFRDPFPTRGEDAIAQFLSALTNVAFAALFLHWIRGRVMRPWLFAKLALFCLVLNLYWLVESIRAGEVARAAGRLLRLARAFALLVASGAFSAVSVPSNFEHTHDRHLEIAVGCVGLPAVQQHVDHEPDDVCHDDEPACCSHWPTDFASGNRLETATPAEEPNQIIDPPNRPRRRAPPSRSRPAPARAWSAECCRTPPTRSRDRRWSAAMAGGSASTGIMDADNTSASRNTLPLAASGTMLQSGRRHGVSSSRTPTTVAPI